jgi:hypothetical protein
VPSGSNVIWVIDSSSIVDLKILPLAIRSQVIRHLNALVAGNRLVYPRQVLEELRSYASPRALESDVPYMWAKGNEVQACHPDRLINEAKAILDTYPDLIDPDAAGRDPADPYIIALAQKLRRDARARCADRHERHPANQQQGVGRCRGRCPRDSQYRDENLLAWRRLQLWRERGGTPVGIVVDRCRSSGTTPV